MGELVRKSNAEIGKRVKRSENWMYGCQDYKDGKPCNGTITNLRSMTGSSNWVRVRWDDGSTNSYEVEPKDLSQLEFADDFKEVYVSDVSEEDAETKKVKKYLVKHKEDEDEEFPFICVNSKENAEKYKEDPESVKTSSWMFTVPV